MKRYGSTKRVRGAGSSTEPSTEEGTIVLGAGATDTTEKAPEPKSAPEPKAS